MKKQENILQHLKFKTKGENKMDKQIIRQYNNVFNIQELELLNELKGSNFMGVYK